MATMHRTVSVAATAALAMVLAACNPQPDDSEGGNLNDEPFIVARTADIDGRDPATATAFQTVQTLDLVYDTLIETGDDGELEPGLATDWEVSDDGRTVTLSLRDGVTFHNGAELTAEDAKATLDRVLDPKTGSVVASNLGNVEEVVAASAHAVILHL